MSDRPQRKGDRGDRLKTFRWIGNEKVGMGMLLEGGNN